MLFRSEDLAVDDYILVHVGYAIQKVNEQDARSSWEMFDEILRMNTDA